MNSAHLYNLTFIKLAFLVIFFHYCSSAPVTTSKNSFSEFIEDLNLNHCVFPQEIQLPFQNPQLNNFEYLSSYLTICQNSKSTKRSKEAVVLCKEIFDYLRNISCTTKTIALPDIDVKLSQQVCSDINALKNSIPENEKSLFKRLTDSFLCDIMCDGEFEKACQVLLWSYKVRKLIDSINTPNNEQMSDALQNIHEEGKNLEAHEKENRLLNISIKSDQPKTSLENNQFLEKIPSANVDDPSKKDKEQGIDLADKIIQEKSGEHKDQNQLAASISIAKTNSNLQENPSNQILNPKAVEQPQELAEDTVNIPNNLNNKVVQETGDHTNLISPDMGEKVQNDLKEESVNLSNDEGLSHFDDAVENNHGSSIVAENKQVISIKNTSFNIENVANTETEKTSNIEKTKYIGVNKKNETLTTATNNDQIVDKADTEVTEKQTKKQESEDATINRNEIEGNQQHSNSIVSNIDKNAQNQAKVINIQGNITNKTKNTLTDQKTTIPIQTKESDQTVPVPEKTSLQVDMKTSTKNSSISKVSNSELSATESSSLVPTETTVALENMEGENDDHQPADKEPDQYNDLENNGDDDEYSRPDYEGNLYENTKTKESNPDVPNTVDVPVPKEVVTSQNEKPMEFPSRDSFGQESNDIQMIAAFPEQEDSHFFFYFLFVVLVLMAGYLIFHNKQKIIALIVEGRHERNRRSHRAGYKKLETK